MKFLRSRWLRWSALALAALAIAAYVAMRMLMPSQATPEQLAAAMQSQARLTGPAKLYVATCAQCHDAGIAPVLRGRGLSPAAIALFVRNGVGAMPSFLPSQISDDELAALTKYVSKLPERRGK